MEFTVKTKIKASAKEIYTSWLDSEKHAAMTGGDANITDKVGDHFTAWDEYISGKNVLLEPFNRIVQSWRTSQFEPDEQDSQIEILLNEVDGETELTLIHTNLAENGGHYEQGWEESLFSTDESILFGLSQKLINPSSFFFRTCSSIAGSFDFIIPQNFWNNLNGMFDLKNRNSHQFQIPVPAGRYLRQRRWN